ncbi:MAG TPA: D-alanyl-D-alanine carboxypeptidase [Flavisolibacter sp.]|nr:D-alanyl-D-alanine carboxypeptidase [Flavisolibacter sp.]
MQQIIRTSLAIAVLALASCQPYKRLNKAAGQVTRTEALRSAHVGISIYDPLKGQYLYEHQGDKYFVPASNIKIPTCYAAMKYLGDSLVGLRYQLFNDMGINVFPTGDPSFLHEDFVRQPVLDFLKSQPGAIYFSNSGWRSQPLGNGWSWNDYGSSYMAERSAFPIYGNTVKLKAGPYRVERTGSGVSRLHMHVVSKPAFFKRYLDSIFVLPLGMAVQHSLQDTAAAAKTLRSFFVNRDIGSNRLSVIYGKEEFSETEIPFFTGNDSTAMAILKADHGLDIRAGQLNDHSLHAGPAPHPQIHKLYSQPTDSLLKPMMHRSDNFFAEQSLLMVSNELLGIMSDAAVIDTLLKTDFRDLPQAPRWVDGSGLSRYNLFTPRDMVAILDKMQKEFGMNRIRTIFPTGGKGTLGSYYKTEEGFIFAKTGTLSGVVALSGFLYTKRGRLLIFSVLVNNHQTSAALVRRSVERFLRSVRENY